LEEIRIENMVGEDVTSAVQLTETMGWGFTEGDFQFMMDVEPGGCFVVRDGEKVVGLTTTIRFEHLGWIGNVIVDPVRRQMGIGSRLVRHAMKYLEDMGVTTIGLYSYLDTAHWYQRMGFKMDKTFVYLVGTGVEHVNVDNVKPIGEEDLEGVLELDRRCIGASREKLLRNIFTRSRRLCYTTYEGDDLVGYVMAVSASKSVEIGPLVCERSFMDRAIDLLQALLRMFIGCDVYIGVPQCDLNLLPTLKDLGFRVGFHTIRMYYGNPLQDTSCIVAMESLERG
jgi:ribosomal protein S18 acetylase RimI-like enzyme